MVKEWQKWTRKQLIENIKTEFNRLGNTTYAYYAKNHSPSFPAATTIYRILNIKKWNDFLNLVGYDVEPKANRQNFSDHQIKIMVKTLADFLERRPKKLELEKIGLSISVIVNHFDSYENLCNEVGIEFYRYRSKVTESEEELIKMYRDFSLKIGHPATREDLDKSDEIYNYKTFESRFGNLTNLRKKAGLDAH